MDTSEDLREHRLLINACLRNRTYFFWQGPGTMLIAGTGIRTVLIDVIESGAKVLGLEGFELDGAVIHPRLDLIFDSGRRPNRDPLTVVTSWGQDVWIDVTLKLPHEPGSISD
jgi:hypothetical protein